VRQPLAAGLKPKILCVGRDPSLNRTRQLVLERQFEVRVAQSVTEAFALLSGQRFDLVLLCYSLSDEECRSAADFVHGLPSPIRILALAEGR
jgi:DNA-binding response OmpR family regulator